MLSVTIICIGKLKEKYLLDAVAEYSARLTPFCRFCIKELPECRLPDNPSEAEIIKALESEGRQIIAKLTKGSFVIPMCIEGKNLSSTELAISLGDIAVSGKSSVDFIIGGSFGLSNEVKARADLKLSMSRMTFPHQLARVMLCEQIYRAFQIMNNGKYHK